MLAKSRFAAALFTSILAAPVSAGLISPTTGSLVSGSLSGGSAGLIVDGSIPPEGQFWQTDTAFWSGTAVTLQVDLGAIYALEDLLVSVDNNDAYQVDYSVDGSSFSTLFTIAIGNGEIGGGMDTMSSDATSGEYVFPLDFSAVTARYLQISATAGDNSYSVGEIQAFGSSPNSVPVPGALLLIGSGLVLISLNCSRKA